MNGGEHGGASRIGALDGLRGWAALVVVVFHFTWELWGTRFPVFRQFPASLINGQLAVSVFFMLSGYVLTIRRWRRDDNGPLRYTLLRRYLRLTIPVFVAALIFFIVMELGLTPTRQAAKLFDSGWLATIANFQPDLFGMVQFALARVYWLSTNHNYGPFLWTMVVEFWGSLIVLSFSQSGRFFREPYTPLLLVGVIMLRYFPQAGCFFAGAMLAAAQVDGVLLKQPAGRIESAIATLAFFAAIIVAAFFHLPTEQLSIKSTPRLLPVALCGIVLVYAAMRSAPLTRFLQTPLSQALGHLSFPVFLIHGVVAATFLPILLLWRGTANPPNELTAVLVTLACSLVSYALAPLLVPVERFTLSFIKQIGRRPQIPS